MNTELKSVFRTCRASTAAAEGTSIIKKLTLENLETTFKILHWNQRHDIAFYRASSSIVPLSTHPVNDWTWWEDKDVLHAARQISDYAAVHRMRLSMHPGQYTVLNSPKPEVVKKAIEDLEYHDRLITLLGGSDLILHTGGAYGDKESAKKRFADNYRDLSESIRRKLRLENDDKVFTVQDVLEISWMCGIPVCFDIHHHNCHNDGTPVDIAAILDTWEGFGIPKIHISTGKESRTDRRHHDFVSEEDVRELIALLDGADADIMFEAKLKEQSILPFLDELNRQ